MTEQFYQNITGLQSPIQLSPAYEHILAGRTRSPFPGNQRKSPSYQPPEDAWKNYEIQELYDELNRLKRSDEAHARWRQEVEYKWKQSQDFIKNLLGKNKMLMEENAQLKMFLHPTPFINRTQQIANRAPGIQWELDAIRKEDRYLKRAISLPPTEDTTAEMEKKYSEMNNEIKTLNVIIQQLHADKTDLIKGGNKIEEESKVLKEAVKRQDMKLNEFAEHERDLKSQLTILNFQTTNLGNENANLNMLLRERI